MPFPSAACQTCKIRRIKCDETRPTCQRCLKSRRVCLDTSAAKPGSLSFHLENCYASGETKRPRGPRSSLTVLRPHLDLQTKALGYYLQYQLQTLTDLPNISEGWSQSVYAWKASGKVCPMVDLALSTLALAIYSRTQQHQPAAAEACSKYYRLLWVAQERISQVGTLNLDERNVDDCLIAVFLMSRYEAAIHSPGTLKSKDSFASMQNWSHHNGALAILKVWNDNLSNKPATSIIKQTRRGLIKSSLLRDLPLPEWILNGSRFGEHDLELEFDSIFTRIVSLHYASRGLQQTNGLYIATADELNIEARELDEALQEWAAKFPSRWSYLRLDLGGSDPWPRRHFYSSTVYSYSKPGYAAVWSQYFATRMLINSTRLRVLDLSCLNPLVDYEYERLECVIQLKAMADSLASTIPFALDRFKVADESDSTICQNSITRNTSEEIKPHLATLAVWPLSIASCLEGIDVKQQQWFRSELAGLGRITGSGVLEGAEMDHWARL